MVLKVNIAGEISIVVTWDKQWCMYVHLKHTQQVV